MSNITLQKKDNVKDILEQYYDLYNSIDKNNPKEEQLNELRTFIENSFDDFDYIELQLNHVLDDLLILHSKNKLQNTVTMTTLNGMKAQMQYSESSIIEKMIIDNIMVSWFRLQIAEMYYTNKIRTKANKEAIDSWDKLVSTAQKRYLRATESLVRIRKSGVKFQINIATDGGKQKNLQV